MTRYFFLLLFLLPGCTDGPAERPNANVIPDEIWFQDGIRKFLLEKRDMVQQ